MQISSFSANTVEPLDSSRVLCIRSTSAAESWPASKRPCTKLASEALLNVARYVPVEGSTRSNTVSGSPLMSIPRPRGKRDRSSRADAQGVQWQSDGWPAVLSCEQQEQADGEGDGGESCDAWEVVVKGSFAISFSSRKVLDMMLGVRVPDAMSVQGGAIGNSGYQVSSAQSVCYYTVYAPIRRQADGDRNSAPPFIPSTPLDDP